MSNTPDYIITTLSESVNQRSTDTPAPFRFGGPFGASTLRGTFYTVGEGANYPITGTNPPPPPPAPTYLVPFIYADFDTDASPFVNVTGSQSTYSGSLDDRGWTNGEPQYNSTDPLSGSYCLQFYDQVTFNTRYGYVNYDTAARRPAWETLFSGSFSVSMWVRPETTTQSRWKYNGMFWLKDPSASDYSFMLILGSNVGGSSNDGSVGWYVSGSTGGWNWFPSASVSPIVANQWNHVVWAISGSIDGNRSIKAYINGIDAGTPYNGSGLSTGFSNKLDLDHTVGMGSWFQGAGYELWGSIDESSVWDFELNSDQVTALYNGGSGANAMTALTQSS